MVVISADNLGIRDSRDGSRTHVERPVHSNADRHVEPVCHKPRPVVDELLLAEYTEAQPDTRRRVLADTQLLVPGSNTDLVPDNRRVAQGNSRQTQLRDLLTNGCALAPGRRSLTWLR